MREPPGEERRKSTRVAWDGRVRLAGARTVTGQILNVSEGGLLVEAGRAPFSVGSELAITFSLPGRDRPIAARAEVVRQQGTQIGLRFLRLSADELQAIAAWVREQDR